MPVGKRLITICSVCTVPYLGNAKGTRDDDLGSFRFWVVAGCLPTRARSVFSPRGEGVVF